MRLDMLVIRIMQVFVYLLPVLVLTISSVTRAHPLLALIFLEHGPWNEFIAAVAVLSSFYTVGELYLNVCICGGLI